MNYSITFPADYKNIPPIRDMVAHTAMLEGFSKKQAEHLRSVADELCNNAVEHGSQPTSEVVLEVHSDDKTIKITCHDQGHGNTLTADEIRKRVSGEVPVENNRGRGMKMIVKSFVDELKIEDRKGGGISVSAILHKKNE